MFGRNRFWVFLAMLVLLLALSALVETPAIAISEEDLTRFPIASTALFAYTLPSPEEPVFLSFLPRFVRGLCFVSPAAASELFLPLLCQDANGRWICQKSYISSNYLIFRQEIACG